MSAAPGCIAKRCQKHAELCRFQGHHVRPYCISSLVSNKCYGLCLRVANTTMMIPFYRLYVSTLTIDKVHFKPFPRRTLFFAERFVQNPKTYIFKNLMGKCLAFIEGDNGMSTRPVFSMHPNIPRFRLTKKF